MTVLEQNDLNEKSKTCNIQIQFNGKVHDTCTINLDKWPTWLDQVDYIRSLYSDKFTNKKLVKTITVKDELINFVLKDENDKNLFVDYGTKFDESVDKHPLLDDPTVYNLENLVVSDTKVGMEFNVNPRVSFDHSNKFLEEFNKSMKKRAWWYIWKQRLKVQPVLSLLSTSTAKVCRRLGNLKVNLESRMHHCLELVITSVSNLNPWKK